MQNIWELIKNNRFDDACNEADLEYQQTGKFIQLNNKLYALMHLKKYNEVIDLANKLIVVDKNENPQINVTTDFYFIILGIANWLLNKKNEAIALWQEGEKCNYQDAAGGIEIRVYEYFAAVKMNDEKLKTLAVKGMKKILKDRRSKNWPGSIGHFLLNEISETELISLVANVPILKERQTCQANFAIAIKELESGNMIGYRNKLQDSIKDGPMAYLEDMYYMAKGELEG